MFDTVQTAIDTAARLKMSFWLAVGCE